MANQTGLQFTFRADGLSHGELLVTAFDYQEGLSQLFNVSLSLASRRDDVLPKEIVDQTGCLTIYQDGEILRHVHGIVSHFSQGDTGHSHSLYHVTLVPAAARLSLRHNSRIFQQQTALDIISILLQEMQIDDYAFACQRTPSTREFCVQYRETDLDFIERLAAEEGLYYFFEQSAGKHTLVFSDNLQSNMQFTEALQYNNLAGGASKAPHISEFGLRHEIASSHTELKDYSFKKPHYAFLKQQNGLEKAWQNDNYEHFDYPGRFKDAGNGEAFSDARMRSLRSHAILAAGKSNIAQLIAGAKFDLVQHLQTDFNRDWCVLSVQHHGEQPQALEEAGGEGMTRYHNDLTVFPSHLIWLPEQNPKPRVNGPQIVKVTGPQGEEIYCDEHGRVKVQFPWDRYSDNNENASCWIRVSQDWAGAQYGSMAIPRIGHEVIVHFLEGDPDQPIITGRTYHA
ncbi:type VI secretion system tip protein TssI/VgrG, partial [Motilimonas pumila]